MKRCLMSILLMIGGTYAMYGCDACGCGMSSMGIGPLADYRDNRIGISWQEVSYTGVRPIGDGPKDRFSRASVYLRHKVSRAWIATVSVPYGMNTRGLADKSKDRIQGLGDAELLVGRSLIDDLAIMDDWSAFAEAHIGMVIPTGMYRSDIHDDNLPTNFNIGRGSWSGLMRVVASVGYRQVGIAMTSRYQLNSKTNNGYHFGNQWGHSTVFYWDAAVTDRVTFTPYAGHYYESVIKDTHAIGSIDRETGGRGSFVNGGVTLSHNGLELNANYYHPIYQSFGSDTVSANGRFTVTISKRI